MELYCSDCTYSSTSAVYVWPKWVESTSTATLNNSSAYTRSDIVWPLWASDVSVTGGASSLLDVTWRMWTEKSYHYVPAQVTARVAESTEAVAEREARALAATERRKNEALQKTLANQRAEQLLSEHLTIKQREQLKARKDFDLTLHKENGQQKHYRIGYGLVSEINKKGEVLRRFCIHPPSDSNVPEADSMLAKKLMLECEEEEFLKVANAY